MYMFICNVYVNEQEGDQNSNFRNLWKATLIAVLYHKVTWEFKLYHERSAITKHRQFQSKIFCKSLVTIIQSTINIYVFCVRVRIIIKTVNSSKTTRELLYMDDAIILLYIRNRWLCQTRFLLRNDVTMMTMDTFGLS